MHVQDAHTQLVTAALPGAEVLIDALTQLRAIRQGVDKTAILNFIGAARQIKDAVRRAAELHDALTAPNLRDLQLAHQALQAYWPFLHEEADLETT